MLWRIEPHGMIEKVSSKNVKATMPITALSRPDSSGCSSLCPSAASAASSALMPTIDVAGLFCTRRA